MSRFARIASVAAILSALWAPTAWADGPTGPDPSSNYPVTSLPAACNVPVSQRCVAAAITDLNGARANLGQPPYILPTNFMSLTPEQQGFVLANLDRLLYGLPPIPGITAALSEDAAVGVQNDTDPRPSDPNFNYFTSNWAGGFYNMPLAYEAWMYDDGPGSGNLDCNSSATSDCWGHRHDVLWSFDGTNPLAMGVSAGTDAAGSTGFAMLLGEGGPGYAPVYTYTWARAVAAGANGGASGEPSATSGSGTATSDPTPAPSSPTAKPVHAKLPPTGVAARVTILSLRVQGHRLSIRLDAPATSALRCALSRRQAQGWAPATLHTCSRTVVFGHLRSGRYRLLVVGQAASATGHVRVR